LVAIENEPISSVKRVRRYARAGAKDRSAGPNHARYGASCQHWLTLQRAVRRRPGTRLHGGGNAPIWSSASTGRGVHNAPAYRGDVARERIGIVCIVRPAMKNSRTAKW